MGGLDAPADGAEEFAVRSGHPAGDHGGPDAGDSAVHRLDQHVGRSRVGLEGFEIGTVRDADRRDRPGRRRIDQPAVHVENVDAADIGHRAQLELEHPVDVGGGHLPFELLDAVDPARAHVGDQVVLNRTEVLELLIEVARQQQHGVLEFAFAVIQRAFPEVVGHDGGADRDCGDQERAADEDPADRVVAQGSLEVEGGGAVCRHVSCRCLGRTPDAVSQHPRLAPSYDTEMEVALGSRVNGRLTDARSQPAITRIGGRPSRRRGFWSGSNCRGVEAKAESDSPSVIGP